MDSQPLTPSTVSPAPAPASSPQAALPNVPDTWPGAWGAYKYSKQAVAPNWAALVGLLLTYMVVNYVPLFILGQHLGRLIGALLSIPLTISFAVAYLAAVRRQKFSYGSAAQAGLNLTLCLKLFAAELLMSLAFAVSLILLVVPFIFVAPRLVLTPYLVVDRKMGPIEALQASWDATKGHLGKLWGVAGAFFAMALLMITIIGIPFSIYFLFMYSAVQALLYEFIMRKQPSATTASAPAQPQAQPPVSPVQQ